MGVDAENEWHWSHLVCFVWRLSKQRAVEQLTSSRRTQALASRTLASRKAMIKPLMCSKGCKPENSVDITSDSGFCSNDSPNVDLLRLRGGGCRVTPTSYSIRSMHWGPGYQYPKSWVLEVSNNGSEGSWAVVDSRENNSDLNDKLVTRNFAVSAPPSGAFRFVRLRQTGKNHDRNDCLWICSLELFGTVSE